MAIVEITGENFEAEVRDCKGAVVLDFWASWCGPCMMMGPVVDAAADEHPELKFGKVNTDEQPELAQMFGISAIPTFVVLVDGTSVLGNQGAMSAEQFEKFLATALS